MPDLKDVGWVWEGQGIDPGVAPSLFGVGEGARFFGLRKACFMFHPNTDLAMDKLSWMDEVVCDISKWKFRWPETGGVAHWVDSAPESVESEAANVASLSQRHPQVTGALHDDMRGLLQRKGWTGTKATQYQPIYEALHAHNPHLKLWAVVYSHELDDQWTPLLPYLDVINLWVWRSSDLSLLNPSVERAKSLFKNKPIVLGCYLRDYGEGCPVPMDLLEYQWEKVAEYVERQWIAGYAILGTVLIEGQLEQATWVRDFISRA